MNTEIDDELRSHIQLRADDLEGSGRTRAEAERQARIEFGGFERFKEECHVAAGGTFFESLGLDLKYACRSLRKSHGFSAVVIVTLALGIGANTAIFSIVDAALVRPLPFRDADRLVRVLATKDGAPIGGASPMDMRDYAAGTQSFEGMVAYDRWRKNVSGIAGSDSPEEAIVGLVPGRYFELLGIRPILGRFFTEQDGVYGNHYVAAISDRVWRERFASDSRVLGKTLRINGETYTIVAVMPEVIPGWLEQTSAPVSIWTPFASMTDWTEEARGNRGDFTLARLKPGVSCERARTELETVAAQLARDHPADRGIGVTLEPLADTRVGPIRPLLWLLSGAVGMVLVIACANLASLLVARNSARARDLAVRVALGASKLRLVRQLLLETVILSLAGGVSGLGLAWSAGCVLVRMRSNGTVPYTNAANALPQFWAVTPETRVLLFTLAISVMTALMFGLAPALTGTRVALAESLREGGRSGTAGTAKQRFRRMLVVTEIGLSLVLVFAASLLVQTMARLQGKEPGFLTDHLLIAHLYLPPVRYPDADAITRFCDAFGDRVRALPGVQETSIATGYPPVIGWKQMFTVPGLAWSRKSEVPTAQFAGVDRHYLRTLGMELERGTDFSDNQTATSSPVAVVNEEFVRRYFPNQDVIGRQIHPGPPPGMAAGPFADFGGSKSDITIVGVVPNFMNNGVAEPPVPQIFTLFRQFPGVNFGFKDIIVRTKGDPESYAPAISRVLQSLDADIPLGEVRSMNQHMGSQTADKRFTTALLGLFAGLGTILAVVGIYGVVAYLVAQRTHEFGVRMALGARSKDIAWLVVKYGLVVGVPGVAVGVAGSLAVRRSLTKLLYGVGASDPLTLVAVSVSLLLAAVLASAVPAARAIRMDPAQTLHRE
jgi:putative ABC transport system permease protein